MNTLYEPNIQVSEKMASSSDYIRCRENRGALTAVDARSAILSALPLMDSETVQLEDALLRHLATDLEAATSLPAFDVSAMDGIAAKSVDVAVPNIKLNMVGTSRPGGPSGIRIENGECIRIFTGGCIPANADCIILQEDCEFGPDYAVVRVRGVRGAHIRKAGLNFSRGDKILSSGTRLTARDIGLVSAAGIHAVEVRRKPRVAVLSTGGELIESGKGQEQSSIYDANGPALRALIRGAGATPLDMGVIGDDIADLVKALSNIDADLLAISGGASKGDYDNTAEAIRLLNGTVVFDGIRIKPGKPMKFAMVKGRPVVVLPGNPVAALVCALLFLIPAVGSMLGQSDLEPHIENASLLGSLGENGRTDNYLRAFVKPGNDGLEVQAWQVQDTSMLTTLARSNALLFRPADAPPATAGDTMQVLRFDLYTGY